MSNQCFFLNLIEHTTKNRLIFLNCNKLSNILTSVNESDKYRPDLARDIIHKIM